MKSPKPRKACKAPQDAPLPPVDPVALERGVRRLVSTQKPPGGWPGKPPKEVRADDDGEEDGDGA